MPKKTEPEQPDEQPAEAPPAVIGLQFVGDPESFIPSWPNESHNDDDPERAARKVASGRYTTTDPLPDLPEPPPPEPEPEPPPPAPRPAFWWETVTPESVAQARAVLEAAAAQQAATRTAEEAGEEGTPPDESGGNPEPAAAATEQPAVSEEQLAQARAILEQAAHQGRPAPPESDAGG